MVAGVSAFVSFDKTVQLTVDGKTSKVHTFASSVQGVLARQGISVGPHDSVVPDLGAHVGQGQRIAVRFGRPLDLDVDGQSRKVWVTATNVNEALDQLGLRDENLYVSASRSEPIGRKGLALRVLTPRDVTVIADGRTRHLQTAAGTIRELLLETGITLDPQDQVNPQLDATPMDGAIIRVVRIDTKLVTVKVEIPFQTKKIPDPTMFPWQRKVITKGVPGLKEVSLSLIRRDGKPAGKNTLSSRVLRQPVTQVERVGTKAGKFAVVPGTARLNWAALAMCESHGDPRAVSPAGPYYGLYQFSASTWHSVGGHGVPTQAGAEEQTYRAQLLYKRDGAHQWPVCGRHLFDK
jgi:resuscitation-promoting factor RpfB